MFATAGTYNGNLGGVAGANAICQAEANTAGLPGTYKAWLSDSLGNSPSTTFSQSTVPYVLTDGHTQFAANWSTLITGTISNNITLTANGTPTTTESHFWTNTNDNGTPTDNNSAQSCGNWTDITDAAQTGTNFGATALWTVDAAAPYGCAPATPVGLYCFQQ